MGGRERGGRTYAILRHIVCKSGDRTRVDEVGMEGKVWGEGKGGRTGLYTHVAKLPTEFIEGAEGVGHRRRGKEALDGRDVASVSLRF